MTYGITNDQYYSDIADAIRAKRTDLPSGTTFTPPQMANAISQIGSVAPWVRPSGWPDLDTLYGNEKNTVWMTLDCTGRFAYPHACFKLTDVAFTVEVGYFDNGTYTVYDTISGTANNNVTVYFDTTSPGQYYLIKLTATSIKTLQFDAWTHPVNGLQYAAQDQNIVEWVGHMDEFSNALRTPYYVEREKIKCINANYNSLNNRWRDAFSLQDLDVSDWSTADWGITVLSNTWYQCYSLRSLDLSSWDVSSWPVTSLSGTWSTCVSLRSLDISGWNTEDWAVTTMASTWENCVSLEELDLSGWDVSGWAVTTLASTWKNCNSLRKLVVDEWDTGDWAVTTMKATFYSDWSLSEFGISGWDTSNWAITDFTQPFYGMDLAALDLSKWDSDGFGDIGSATLTTFSYMRNLKELDLSGINAHMFFPGRTGTTSTTLLANCPSIVSLRFGALKTNTISDLNVSFSANPLLDRASLLAIINNLASGVSGNKLTLGSTNLNKLTAAEKAVATGKGWTLA